MSLEDASMNEVVVSLFHGNYRNHFMSRLFLSVKSEIKQGVEITASHRRKLILDEIESAPLELVCLLECPDIITGRNILTEWTKERGDYQTLVRRAIVIAKENHILLQASQFHQQEIGKQMFIHQLHQRREIC